MGDFNIDWSEKTNPNFKKLLELTKSLGLRQIIRDVTRPTLNKNICIDLILTNSDDIENAGAFDINLSDHMLIHCNRKRIKLPKVNVNLSDEVIEIMIRTYFNKVSEIQIGELLIML